MSAETNLAPAASHINREEIARVMGLNLRDSAVLGMMIACEKYGLDPILKHAIVIPNKGLYVTRDGLMHVAHASGQFDGMEVECIADSETHLIARASVWRKDMNRPFTFQGRYPKSGRMAKDYGPEMAEKVALCRALRHAFDVSLCSREEAWEDDETITGEVTQEPRRDHHPPASRPAPTPLGESVPKIDPKDEARLKQLKEAQKAFMAECTERGMDYRDGDGKPSPEKLRAIVLNTLGDSFEQSNGMGDPATWSIALDRLRKLPVDPFLPTEGEAKEGSLL